MNRHPSGEPDPSTPTELAVLEAYGPYRTWLRAPLSALALEAHRFVADTADVAGVAVTAIVGTSPVSGGSNRFSDAVVDTEARLDDGPCHSALRTGQPVRSASIGASEPQWPTFSDQAGALGLRSVVSSPVVVDDEVMGCLTVYGAEPDSLASSRLDVARAALDTARSLREVHLLATTDLHTRTFVRTLTDRADIDLAVGLLMDRYVMTPRTAQALLVQLARLDGVGVADAARGLLDPEGPR